VRSIEYAPMAGFFNPRSELDPELSDYFAGFGQVISYLFDPDGFFEGNLRRCGVENLITGEPRISAGQHAARQLARPLESLALFLDDEAARVFPSEEDHAAAEQVLRGLPSPLVAIHPGSGSEKKNWPLPAWTELVGAIARSDASLLVVSGESDSGRTDALKKEFPGRLVFLEGLPLSILGAILTRCAFFIGHDSGISHLAAAAGTTCLLLFGPTDPDVWAPKNPGVNVLRAEGRSLPNLTVADVLRRLPEFLNAR